MLEFSCKIEQMNFPQFIELRFIEWQRQEGGRKTITEFAEYLGCGVLPPNIQQNLNNSDHEHQPKRGMLPYMCNDIHYLIPTPHPLELAEHP